MLGNNKVLSTFRHWEQTMLLPVMNAKAPDVQALSLLKILRSAFSFKGVEMGTETSK